MNNTAKTVQSITSKLPSNLSSERGHIKESELQFQSTVTFLDNGCEVGFSSLNNLTIVLPNDKHTKARVKKLLELIASDDFTNDKPARKQSSDDITDDKPRKQPKEYKALKQREYRARKKNQGLVVRYTKSFDNQDTKLDELRVYRANKARKYRLLIKRLTAACEMIDALKAEIETLRFDNKKDVGIE